MLSGKPIGGIRAIPVLVLFTLALSNMAWATELGPVEMVTWWLSDVEYDVIVTGYSVPSFADWNNDGLKDLIVGQGSGTSTPKVRVYLNEGTAQAPKLTAPFYAQSGDSDLTATGEGCMGLFPRVCYWDGDGLKDLIVGDSVGGITFFRNIGSDASPTFDGGTFLQVGTPGSKTNIDVGDRTCVDILDWDNDGMKDLVVGDYSGNISAFINEGTDDAPDFLTETFIQSGSGNLLVPIGRASPVVVDFDGDGMKDILTGNTNGQLFLYSNVGTDASPLFDGYTSVAADGTDIDLTVTRSRPDVCDWTGDGLLDVLIGASGGKVYLYQGVPEPCSAALLGVGCLLLCRRRRRRAAARG